MLDYKEYVYAVYQERSFSKAARKLFVSQPWLSSTVKKVEQELNLQLFDRSTNPISLTEAGKYYIENVERIMAIEDEMQQHFQQMSMAGASIHIGSSMFFCTYVLPRLMGMGTRLICSGILDTRLADVTAALTAAGIQVTSIRAKEDWRCVVGQRK